MYEGARFGVPENYILKKNIKFEVMKKIILLKKKTTIKKKPFNIVVKEVNKTNLVNLQDV